ncbi:Crp/Fnr family transcriptional regulator [Agromyces bracchium]|uniref:Helix-turn-helix domain-containing protein n=1 Tax=Agromyces bracchium TaxID=88376 RepID=A0A6I3M0X3_9MICO|nr:Crp/Fnr family transcriptional regulator [Agromyces bracchium]MTH67014.1 helix-turn-helix domain-containing protein [Agromyces bracchium]
MAITMTSIGGRGADPATGGGQAGEVDAAIARSHLRAIPPAALHAVLEHAVLRDAAAGEDLHREGDHLVHLELVVSGLVRVFVSAPDGRTLTVRYCRSGSLMGAVSMFAADFTMPASVRAVTASRILAMPAAEVAALVGRDPVAAAAMLGELAERAMAFLNEIPGSAFATVRQRVARHLLDLASASASGGRLRARVSQQELADAIGSVREVVVRALRDLRREGLVETGHDGIDLLDPERLAAEAYPTGSAAPSRSWNPGS